MAVLALFQYEPYCSRECGSGIISALSSHHDIQIITRHDLTSENLARFDMVIFPGGRGDASAFRQVLKTKTSILQAYVKSGGTYLGICMGAYWADRLYFDLIGETRCVQYITRPKAEIRRSFPTLVRSEWLGQGGKFYFFDGCTFIESEQSVQPYANYANGDAMAVIKGNVGLIGCHLESELSWYQTKAMKPAWHDYSHHRLLKEFVDDLLSKGRSFRVAIDRPAIRSTSTEDQADLIVDEIELLKAALHDIERETSMFTQGTFKKIHDIARQALSQISPSRAKRD